VPKSHGKCVVDTGGRGARDIVDAVNNARGDLRAGVFVIVDADGA